MSKIDLDDLEATAKAAVESPTWDHDLFRAAATPDTVLALIRVVRAARELPWIPLSVVTVEQLKWLDEMRAALKEIEE